MKTFEDRAMNDRTEYQREYMRARRAKERQVKATGQAATADEGFTTLQRGQLQEIIRGELETLLTQFTVSSVNSKARVLTKLTVSSVNGLCLHCGKTVKGRKGKLYCSDNCRKAAFRRRAKTE